MPHCLANVSTSMNWFQASEYLNLIDRVLVSLASFISNRKPADSVRFLTSTFFASSWACFDPLQMSRQNARIGRLLNTHRRVHGERVANDRFQARQPSGNTLERRHRTHR